MSVILFIIILVTSFIIVRIGAIAFQLTGLEWSLAKFQALSCFSGTGFTTKESELITSNPRRRKIATVLIVLGNAGIITMVATVASALNAQQTIWQKLSESFLPFVIPLYLVPWVNLAIIVISVYAVFKFFTNKKVLKKLTNSLRKRIIKKELFKPVAFEDLMLVTEGYCISKIEVRRKCPVLNKTLIDSGLRKNDITVLAVIRGEKTIPNPPSNITFQTGDEIVSFGKLDNIREYLCADI